MKLSQLQEARYTSPSSHYTEWVKNQVAISAKFSEYPLEDLDEVRAVVDDLTNGLGKPDLHDAEEKYEYWGWHLRPDDPESYAVYVNTSPELFVERISNITEARYTSHPVVDWVDQQEGYQRKKIPPESVDAIVRELTKAKGEPETGTGADGTKSWYWVFTVEQSGEVVDSITVRQFADDGSAHVIVSKPEFDLRRR